MAAGPHRRPATHRQRAAAKRSLRASAASQGGGGGSLPLRLPAMVRQSMAGRSAAALLRQRTRPAAQPSACLSRIGCCLLSTSMRGEPMLRMGAETRPTRLHSPTNGQQRRTTEGRLHRCNTPLLGKRRATESYCGCCVFDGCGYDCGVVTSRGCRCSAVGPDGIANGTQQLGSAIGGRRQR